MGRGNFLPMGMMTDQWYIDYDRYYLPPDEDEGISEGFWDMDSADADVHEIMRQIRVKFPSFEFVSKVVDHYWGQEILLENKLFSIGVADNEWSIAIWISERRDRDTDILPFAMRHFDNYKNAIRKILVDYYGDISLRNGAWMSIRWTQEMEKMTGIKTEKEPSVV